MFFLKKRTENVITESIIKEQLSQLSDTCRQENADTKKALDKMQQQQMEMQKFLRKKMETLDDFLDQLEEEKETQEEAEELRKEASEREIQLCQLIGIYSEQMHTIEALLADKEGWNEQFLLMGKKRKQLCGLAQIQETGNIGEPFDYRLHEIIKTEETDQDKLEGIISQVYVPGILYRGKIIKKAQVCVYRK